MANTEETWATIESFGNGKPKGNGSSKDTCHFDSSSEGTQCLKIDKESAVSLFLDRYYLVVQL